MPSKRKNKSMVQASMNHLPIGPKNGAPADPKLFHLVKKLLNSTPSSNRGGLSSSLGADYDDSDDDDGPNRQRRAPSAASSSQPSNLSGSANVTDIVERLRNQHREYVRKDLERLTMQVETIVQQLQAPTASASPHSAGRKRKVCDSNRRLRSDDANNDNDGDDTALDRDEFGNEVLYEEAALQHDALQRQLSEAAAGSGGGGLNAALRNRYLANAQEQRKLTAVAQPSVLEGKPAATENANTEAAATSAAPNESDAVKSPKLKRKVTKLLKRSSSSGGLAYRSQSNGGLASDPSSSCAFLTPVPRPPERYRDLGGMDSAIQELRQLVEYPLMRPELYRHLGIDPPRGVLLRGPPGCGKTHFANAGTSVRSTRSFRPSSMFVLHRHELCFV
jgi:hypothetical protein